MSQPIQQPPRQPVGSDSYGRQPGYGYPPPNAAQPGGGLPPSGQAFAGGQPVGAQPPAGGQPAGPGWPAGPGGQPANPGWQVGMPGTARMPQAPGRLGAGLLAGTLTMIVVALVYGGLLRAMSNSDGSYHEFSYAALAVGLAVGAATGKVGGRHSALPIAGLVLAVVGVFLGEMFGLALIGSHVSNGAVSVTDILFQHFGVLVKAWKSEFDLMSAFFYCVAAFEGFVVTRRMSQR